MRTRNKRWRGVKRQRRMSEEEQAMGGKKVCKKKVRIRKLKGEDEKGSRMRRQMKRGNVKKDTDRE
jgi:hypothetical protein